MEFKKWLELDEARLKGFKRMFQNNNPNMPKYVQNDLYNTRIGHTMNTLVKNSSNPSSIPNNSSSKIFNQAGFNNVEWSKTPEFLGNGAGVTPANFTEKTRQFFIMRAFGFKEETRIKNDAQRMQKQKEIMDNSISNEPVIVRQTLYGYELLEGWHRTMNYLLKGCPKEQIMQLKNWRTDYLDFSKWTPVQIKAYIGIGPEVKNAIAGTGDFIPSAEYTAKYNPN